MLLIALCTALFGMVRSVFERVGLPAVQGKCMTDLHVTYKFEVNLPCRAGSTTRSKKQKASGKIVTYMAATQG
jgi:hypothetical protein